MKEGSKVPVANGILYSATGTNRAHRRSSPYLDVGMNFDATLDELADGARLRSKVEQLSIAEQTSGVGFTGSDHSTKFPWKARRSSSWVNLWCWGRLIFPGSTRHLDVEVMMEQVAK